MGDMHGLQDRRRRRRRRRWMGWRRRRRWMGWRRQGWQFLGWRRRQLVEPLLRSTRSLMLGTCASYVRFASFFGRARGMARWCRANPFGSFGVCFMGESPFPLGLVSFLVEAMPRPNLLTWYRPRRN